jgi:o-succinylbenzoate synthase
MRAKPFSLPLSRPLSTARGDIRKREGFLVRATVDGHRGRGEATPLPGWTEPLEACRTALVSVSEPVEALSEDLDGTPAARHGVELAVADARARVREEPLCRYLSGHDEPAERVPVNATVGDEGVDATVEAAREAVCEGFGTLKVKVGVRSPEADIARLEAVRDACPDLSVRADANGAWDRETARETLERLSSLGLEYVEQPLAADDVAGLASLGGDVPVALDETLAETPVAEVLDAGAADVLVLKPMSLGGPVRARAAAEEAREAGVGCVVTTTIDAAVARAGAVHLAASIPDVPACGLATGGWLARDVREPDPVPVSDGSIRVPSGVGLGI